MLKIDRAPVITNGAPQASMEERIELAVEAWSTGKPALSQRAAAKEYGVSYSTLNDRIRLKALSATEYHQKRQYLHPHEESSLVEWITRMQRWNWPVRVERVRFIAEDIL